MILSGDVWACFRLQDSFCAAESEVVIGRIRNDMVRRLTVMAWVRRRPLAVCGEVGCIGEGALQRDPSSEASSLGNGSAWGAFHVNETSLGHTIHLVKLSFTTPKV